MSYSVLCHIKNMKLELYSANLIINFIYNLLKLFQIILRTAYETVCKKKKECINTQCVIIFSNS